MAVAVKNMPESTTRTEGLSLATASVLGAVYVFAAIAAVAFGVPMLWNASLGPWVDRVLGSFVSGACLIVIELCAVGLLGFVGVMLTGGKMRPGLKAGIFTVAATVLLMIIVVSVFAPGGASTLRQGFAVACAAAILFFAWRWFSNPKFNDRMRSFESQGWFTAQTYKPNQGRKVRRATTLGLLIMAGCGVWTLLHHGTLEAAGSKDLKFDVPFTQRTIVNDKGESVVVPLAITLLPDIRYTIPIILIAATIWFSFRLVNWPTFADFLIATEGELNKIAWPTRRSLWQDTIVVLATVIIMTLFLFFVDVAWGKILGNKWIGILQLPEKTATQPKDVKELDWD